MPGERAGVAWTCVLVAGLACNRARPRPEAPEIRQAQSAAPVPEPGKASVALCLADVLGDLRDAGEKIRTSACADEGGASCARACAGGDAAACYARALKVQRERIPTSSTRASVKFRKACELGLAIACTNYAAGLWLSEEQDDRLRAADLRQDLRRE